MDHGSLTLLSGLPGSGKSFAITELQAKSCNTYIVVCPDDYRFVLSGRNYFQSIEDFVWSCAKATVRAQVSCQKRNVIVDATHISVGSRAQWVRMAKELEVPISCIFFATSTETCKERNAQRLHNRVPDEVIDRMAKDFVPPAPQEGFMSVIVWKGGSNAKEV